jgi:hypothetical protein
MITPMHLGLKLAVLIWTLIAGGCATTAPEVPDEPVWQWTSPATRLVPMEPEPPSYLEIMRRCAVDPDCHTNPNTYR